MNEHLFSVPGWITFLGVPICLELFLLTNGASHLRILFWLDSCRAKLLIFRHQSSLTLQYIEYTNISLEWKRDSVQISNYRILFPSKSSHE